MFCPYCGSKLKEVPNPEIAEFEDKNDAWIQGGCEGGPPPHPSQAEHWCCENNDCVFSDLPLIKHHPYHGVDAKPGDSWSLSWIK